MEPANGQPADGRDMIDVTINISLPGDYLRKVDVMSMAHGLEVRVPFLGKARIGIGWREDSSSTEAPSRGTAGKMLLRTMLGQYLPDEITRRRKSGFGIPLDSSLNLEKRQAIEAMLTARDARRHPGVDRLPDYTRTVSCGRLSPGSVPSSEMEPLRGLSERLHALVAGALAAKMESVHMNRTRHRPDTRMPLIRLR